MDDAIRLVMVHPRTLGVQQVDSAEAIEHWRERGYCTPFELSREELVGVVQRLAVLVDEYRESAWDSLPVSA